MTNKKTGNFRKLKANFSPTFRDRGLSSTVGLLVSFSMQSALANNSITTPIVPSHPMTLSTTGTSHATFSHHIHSGYTGSNGATNGNTTSGSTANNQTSSTTSTHGHGSSTGSTDGSSSSSLTSSSSSGSTGSTGSTSSSVVLGAVVNVSSPRSIGSVESTSSAGSTSSTGSSGANSQTGSSTSALGATSTHSHTHGNPATSTSTASGTAAINLQSSAATYTLGTLGNFKTVTIDVGGQQEQVTATTKLTSAELLAADQALHSLNTTATQSLVINAQGVATGGEFTLTGGALRTLETVTGGVGSITIPSQVTLDDKVKVLNISGDLVNDGSIIAQTHSSTGNLIEAMNITNASGASISGSGALTLTATQTLSNAGSITGKGDLTLNAATLTNAPSSSVAPAAPAISAGHDLTINAPTVNNSGTLSAAHDTNFTNTSSIAVNQTSQANISAGNNINFRDSAYTGTGNVTINGGNLLSKNLNIYAPSGEVGLTAGNVTGQLNGNIGALHTNTQASTLILGNLNITGDPQFYNQGNISIAGGVHDTNGVPLALVATGNITSNGGSLITAGGDLTLVAGTNYTTNDGTVNSITGPNWSSVLTLTGASSTGGYIDLTGAATGTLPITAISTAATAPGDGGNLTMVAYAGSAVGSGTIATPSSVTINVNGIDYVPYNVNPAMPVLSTNGNVTIIANGTSNGTAINIGSPIIANGATGGGGQILISTGAPTAVGTTIAGVASPYELVNGQPYGSFTANTTSTGLTLGNITVGAITGYQPSYNTPELGGNISISTNGAITNTGNLYDEGIQLTLNSNFIQTTNWQAGGISVTTSGYFAQAQNSVTTIDGVGGQYNINAGGQYVNLQGTDNVHGGIQPASLNITESNSAAPIYIGYTPGLGHVSVDDASFTGASTIVVNGSLTTQTSPDSPPGGGNLTFTNNNGNLTINGTGTITNSGTFTAIASGNIALPITSAPAINRTSNPNGWVFNAGGSLTIPFTSLTTAADPMTGNGGTISLTYGGNGFFYAVPTNNPITLTANGANSGTTQNGGTVTVNISDSFAQNIGNNIANFVIAANSGTLSTATGGSVSFTSPGSITINPTYISNTGAGNGGSISFTSSGNILVNGSLNEAAPLTGGSVSFTSPGNIYVAGSINAAPTGGNSALNYGNIAFNQTETTTGFLVGASSTNGVLGSLTGNTTITNPIGVVVAQGSSITGNDISLTGFAATNNGTIMGALVGDQVTSTVTLNVNKFNNATTGLIGAAVGNNGTSLVSFVAPTGDLTISGAGTWGNTFGYSFASTSGAVFLGPLFTPNTPHSDPTFEQITLNAQTNVNIAADGLTTNGGAQGLISIHAAQINYPDPTTKPFTLTANGSNSAMYPQDGINVDITSTGTVIIGTGPGQLVLQAEQGNVGGSISVTNGGGAIIANENTQSLNNQNGNLSLTAATNVEVVGAIAQGSGSVTLTSTTPTSLFTVGTTVVPNGVSGNISGGLITLNEPTVVVNNGSSISGTGINLNSDVLTNNGTLTIAGANPTGLIMTGVAIGSTTPNLLFTNNGTITSPAEISLTTIANITVAGTGTYAPTLVYNFSGAAVNLGPLFATVGSNPFSTLIINATGLITLGTNDLKTQGLMTNAIDISSGGGISYLNQNTGPLTLDTRSTNGGGSVTYTALTNKSIPIIVGNGATDLTIYTSETAMGGSGMGNISLSGVGGVIVNPNYLFTNTLGDANASTNISLTGASGSNVLVTSGNAATGWSNSLLGPMGSLNVTTNSTSAFVVGPTAGLVNGIYTSNPVSGGSITITNNGGGITLSLANALQAQANGGFVSLTAANSITQTVASQTISAPTVTLDATAGSVGTSTAPILIGTPAGATASTVNLSSPTVVYVTDSSAGLATVPMGGGPAVNTLILNASTPAISFTANNANAPLVLLPNGLASSSVVTINAFGSNTSQGIETDATIGNQTGGIYLNAGTGTITENPTFNVNTYPPVYIEGTSVALTANSVLSTNPTNSNFLVTENALSYNGTMTAGELIVNNNFFPTTLNAGTTVNFNYLTDGTLTIAGTQTTTGNYHVTSWGNINEDAAINGSGGAVVTLQTVSGGYISSLNNSVVTAPTVNLTSDYGNLTVGVNTPTLHLTTTGVINLANNSTVSNSVTVTVTPTFMPTSFLLNSTGPVTVASGISTTNGNIEVESAQSIVIEPGETLHASSTTAGLGAVYLTIGALPATPEVGVKPAGVIVTNTGGGVTYFGSSTYPNNTIEAIGTNQVNASGRNVIFNANGTNPSSIILEGSDIITADPPIVSSAPNTTPSVPAVMPSAVPSATLTNFASTNDLSNAPTQTFGAIASIPLTVAATSSIPAQSGASPTANLFNQNTSALSSFNTTSLVHSDLSNGVSLTAPALSGASTNVFSVNSLSSTAPVLVTAPSSSLPAVSAVSPQATSSTAATAGVVALNNANALTAEKTLTGGVSLKRHSHNLNGDTNIGEAHKVLDSGAMILCPEHDVTVESPFGKVSVAAKSLVVLVATNSGLSVFNLHDESRNSVMIVADGKTTDVYPGRHVTISNAKEEKFEEINPGLFIPHRNMRVYDAGSKKVYTSEFHIQSAIRGIEPLQALLSSPDREKQKMANKVYKTIAVLQVLSGKGSFELLTPKPLTAYNIESKAVYEGAAH